MIIKNKLFKNYIYNLLQIKNSLSKKMSSVKLYP